MSNCYFCDGSFAEEELIEIDGVYYCSDCVDRLFVICHECNKFVPCGTEIYYNDECYCNDCLDDNFAACAECDDVHEISQMLRNDNGNYICQDCFEYAYFVCDGCGTIHHQDEEYCLSDRSYCEDCYQSLIDEYHINEYSFKPTPIFYQTKDEFTRKHNLHIGIELEIQGHHRFEFCDDIHNEFSEKEIYLKLDGSLNSYGIEVVSMPMTKRYMEKERIWERIFNLISVNQMDDISHCGLHFHLDRQYFDASAIATIDYVVNTFSDYFEKIGGRPFETCGSYCNKVYKEMQHWGKDITNRYVAVNLENTETIELRFCKSTTDYNVFCERLRMAFALASFSLMYEFNDVVTWSKRKFLIRFKKCLLKQA